MGIWSDEDDDMTTQELTPREITRELRRLTTAVDKVSKYVFGNGEPGIDEVVRNTSDKVDRLSILLNNLSQSFEEYKRVKETFKTQEAVPLTVSDRILKWFSDKVLPGLVTGFITTIITIIAILAIIHYTEIFK